MIRKIVNFGIVGIIATIIDFLTLYIMHSLFYLNLYFSVTIAFALSLILNFILSMKFVFQNNKNLSTLKQILIFTLTSIIGLLINQIIIYLLSGLLNIHYIISKILATIIVMIFNFVSRHIIFEK